MSITKQVVALVNQLGSGTVDDLMPLMPGHTRAQLFRALKYGMESRLIESDGHRPPTGPGTGSRPAIYRAKRTTYHRPAASVWQFAQQAGAAA